MVVPSDDPEDPDRPRGILSTADRNFLTATDEEREENYSRSAGTQRERAIRERTVNALRDFRFLSEYLSPEEREKIFDAEPHLELVEDVTKAIEFLYIGMGGESEFRQPLKRGVASGESRLGSFESALDVSPQFSVERPHRRNRHEIVDLVEAGEWERLYPPDLFTFIRGALDEDALDFDSIRNRLDRQEWNAEYQLGKKYRAIPGGKRTPMMDPEVFDSEGIGEMSVKELRDLFGDGYSPTHIYDGEKVLRPPPMGSDGDPEIVEWIHGGPDDETGDR